MTRYSFTLEDGAYVAPEDATEEFASKRAAIDHAKLVAKDLAQSHAAENKLLVVVRDEAGKEVGSIPVIFDLR